MSKPAAIIDLDNCISDDQWRLPLIQPHRAQPNDRYWAYHDLCHCDVRANKLIIDSLQRSHQLLVFTSRPEVVRAKTESWLRCWGIARELLYMRPNDNHMPSVELKRLMLSWLPAQYRVERAIDDRQDILDMYREQGIKQTDRVFIYENEVVHP